MERPARRMREIACVVPSASVATSAGTSHLLEGLQNEKGDVLHFDGHPAFVATSSFKNNKTMLLFYYS
jgi:hypothetical protein